VSLTRDEFQRFKSINKIPATRLKPQRGADFVSNFVSFVDDSIFTERGK